MIARTCGVEEWRFWVVGYFEILLDPSLNINQNPAQKTISAGSITNSSASSELNATQPMGPTI